jgi:imidazolonepropionase-like amidohydrolase
MVNRWVMSAAAAASFFVVSLEGQSGSPASATCFTGATVVSRSTGPDIENAYFSVIDRAFSVVSPMDRPAASGTCVDLKGKFVIPGLISAHAHVPDVKGLAVFARYGITTVWSLGGEQAAQFRARGLQTSEPNLDRARIYLAGTIVNARTEAEARQQVATVASTGPDIIKIRVDDNLGTTAKMPPEAYRAVIDEAHKRDLRVAAHLFYLDDAKDLLRAGVDVIAHSVRDKDIDDEFISLMKSRGVPYIPTLTREVAAFVYESTPAFFDDPFFLREADPAVIARLKEPARQQTVRESVNAQKYKAALVVAGRNLKKAADAGLLIAMGTDSGAQPERFQGYFEHLEMEMMVKAGMTPTQVLKSATGDAAKALRLHGTVGGIGTFMTGSWADFVVLDKDPRVDIRNTRSISALYLNGQAVKR